MNRIIGVVSGKGGVGKTVFVANVGLALTRMNQSVTTVDADMETSNLGLHLGLCQYPIGLQDALTRDISAEHAIYVHPTGLRVLPSSLSVRHSRNYTHHTLNRTLRELQGLILIDSPPGLGRRVSPILRACHEVIVITNPEIPAVTDAMKVIELARDLKKMNISIVLNRCTGKHELRPEEIQSLCGTSILGSIPEDRAVKRSLFHKTPIVGLSRYSPASLAFRSIASRLAGLPWSPPRMLRLRRFLSRDSRPHLQANFY